MNLKKMKSHLLILTIFSLSSISHHGWAQDHKKVGAVCDSTHAAIATEVETLVKAAVSAAVVPVPSKLKNKSAVKFDIDARMVELGRDSLELLRRKKFVAFDPILSDWSCQLRTLWLINLVRNHPTLDDLQEDELKILGMYRLLTMIIVQRDDALGMPIDQKSNSKMPESWGEISKTKANEYITNVKMELSRVIKEDLLEKISSSSLSHKSDLLKIISRPTFTTYSGAPVSFVEFFPGYVAILGLAHEMNIPLIMNLQQYVKKEGAYYLNGMQALKFRPIGTIGEYVYDPVGSIGGDGEDNDPALTFSIYGAEVVEANFASFVESFLTRNIREIILQVAAAHDQYPRNAYLQLASAKIAPGAEGEGPINLLYKEMKAKAIEDAVGTIHYMDPTGKRFTQRIPLNVKHTYVSSLEQVQRQQEELMLKAKGIAIGD